MSDTDTEALPEAHARVRGPRWLAWVWVVPAVAAAIVLWLAWRGLTANGPEITISFATAQGLRAGESTIQYRGVVVGTVERLALNTNLSRVIVHARMARSVSESLREGASFYVVTPRVSGQGITGLSTIVSGSYIEMYMGSGGKPARHFAGLDTPPVMTPEGPGRTFTLLADDLGSLTYGAPVTYRGISIGEVTGYTLDADGKSVRLTAFVRAPYDQFVRPQTRFWNAGGIDITIGPEGARVRANSWQQLLSGGIAFDTPPSALADASSKQNQESSIFVLYENENLARSEPRGATLEYETVLPGTARDLLVGSPVELQGVEVGTVKNVVLTRGAKGQSLATRVTFAVDPERIAIDNAELPPGKSRAARTAAWLEELVGKGLRAQMITTNLLTGRQVIGLEIAPQAARAEITHEGSVARIPSVPAGDLTAVVQSLRGVLDNLQRATAGPELKHAVVSLDATVTHLESITRQIDPNDVKVMVTNLRDTADAARTAMNSMQATLGNAAADRTDLATVMGQLEAAARSVRSLADYLDRHPEALLRGRATDP
jgi:paraquat-inducible protein B